MLRSNSFLKTIRDRVSGGQPPAGAMSHTVDVLTARLGRVDNALVKEKIQDIRDLAAQLAQELLDPDDADASCDGAIIAVPQPVASTLFHLPGRNVGGVAIFDAGVTSHTSIHLRTADVGGDKIVRGLEQHEEANPFLGARGIRGSLDDRGLFRRQLPALLRAGHEADLGIMFPMVTSVEEVTVAREEVAFARFELEESGVPHNPRPRIGAMIETPAAALAVERLV